MSRLFEASRCQLRHDAQLLRRPRSLRISCAPPLYSVAIVVLAAATLSASPVRAQDDAVDAQPVRDTAVEAIQRARALAERQGSAASDAVASDDTPAHDTTSTTNPSTPRPLGQPRATSTPLDASASVDASSGWILSTLSALGVVIGLIFAARWCLARMQHGGNPAATSSAAVEVLARTPIGNRQAVTLLRVGGRVIVVGDAGGAMTTLADIDDEQEVADLLQSVSTSRADSAASGFRDLYRQMAGLAGNRHADTPSDHDTDPHAATELYGDRSQAEVRNLLARVRGTAAEYAAPGAKR